MGKSEYELEPLEFDYPIEAVFNAIVHYTMKPETPFRLENRYFGRNGFTFTLSRFMSFISNEYSTKINLMGVVDPETDHTVINIAIRSSESIESAQKTVRERLERNVKKELEGKGVMSAADEVKLNPSLQEKIDYGQYALEWKKREHEEKKAAKAAAKNGGAPVSLDENGLPVQQEEKKGLPRGTILVIIVAALIVLGTIPTMFQYDWSFLGL